MTTSTPQRAGKGTIESALLAGFIAGFAWMVITVLVGDLSTGVIVGGGFIFLVGTAVISAAISATVRSSRRR